ncbi:efflux RND transporter periplasmic adaptor subunit [Micromonospora sp. NPDC050397]|uniref:efflux RND transporter periplasmic adaptor subunit n=1 Tax=Micromonospora sp. NPDC050397 TaxID=3364279 RepID=UPI0038506323
MPVRRLVTLRRPSMLVNAVLGLAVVGGGLWVYTSFVRPDPSSAATGDTTRTVPVGQGTVTATVSAAGTLRSAATASANFGTAGTVSEIRVRVGDLVTKDAVLAKVDPTAANRQLAAARANLAAAEAARDRAETAGVDPTDAESQVTTAQLAVDAAQDAVDGTVLKAPMAGTVVAVNGNIGGSTGGTSGASGASGSNGSSGGSANGSSGGAPGTSGGNQQGSAGSGGTGSGGTGSGGTGSGGSSGGSSNGFVQLADLSRLEVSASVAEADATRLKIGQPVTIAWNALTGATATGKLASIDPNATTSSNVVTYGVVFTVDKLPPGARPGQTVEASVTVGQVADAIYVNPAALTTVGNRHTVTVLVDGRQVTRSVEVGLTGDLSVQITSGLQVGELVVLRATGTGGGGTSGFPGGSTGGGRPGGGGFTGGGGFPRGAGGGR